MGAIGVLMILAPVVLVAKVKLTEDSKKTTWVNIKTAAEMIKIFFRCILFIFFD